ncbi:hypothetical protein [Cryobacterium sp. PH29-G1]|uniref:hypothetical protein n=1 Tax=Cryobacterium sp. PH29-G1 TaxID=3046211 RepID=UPI0024BB03C9|nr:hypothetical protein [Cryobacterium sp. PH29-G1]MDJ0347763.1 hypothetical protein [Cryobacterium sp. PH29-G1]
MSDNTPIDGNENSETDAAAARDLGRTDPTATDPTVTDPTGAPERAEPTAGHEPLVIDYDAINANLNTAEHADADAPRLADDYADSAASTTPVRASSTPVEPEVAPVVAPAVVAPVAVSSIDGAAAVPPPAAHAPVGTAPNYSPPAQSPIYVQAPTKPKDRSNRGGGILIALLATVVFAVLYAVAAFIIIGLTSTTVAVTVSGFTAFATLPVFYIPVIFFFLAYSALIAVVNRGGWWAYVLFGFLVAVVVYFSYIGGAVLGLVIDGRADGLGAAELGRIVGTLWLNPGAIAAGLIAREVPIWAGAWIARRGRRVTAKNLAARTEYERLLADGPHLTRP